MDYGILKILAKFIDKIPLLTWYRIENYQDFPETHHHPGMRKIPVDWLNRDCLIYDSQLKLIRK